MFLSAFWKLSLVFIFNSFIQGATAQTRSMDSLITPASLEELVKVLAADSLKGRFTTSPEATLAAEFIAQEFKKAGALPLDMNEGYFMPIPLPGGNGGLNVMAGLKGKTRPGEIIIFCAHYDHIGTKSTNPYPNFTGGATPRLGDTIFNGANDNASGTSAVITLARYFGHLNNNDRTILFVAFSGEELGLLGSKTFSAALDTPQSIKAVINIEMIGRPRSKKKRNAFITGPNLSDLKVLMNDNLFASRPEVYGKKFFVNDTYPDDNLFSRSDNYSFALKGIPAHTVMSTPPNDKFYHSQSDEPSTLDFELMSHLVKAIAVASQGLVDGTDTPRRISPNRLP